MINFYELCNHELDRSDIAVPLNDIWDKWFQSIKWFHPDDPSIGEEFSNTVDVTPIKHLLKSNARCVFFYSYFALNGRWYEAEEVIKTEPYYCYYYAYHIVKGRWPEVEPYLLESMYVAFDYACKVVGERWPELEEILLKYDTYYCYLYAEQIIKGRWHEAEADIMKVPHVAEMYYEDVAQGDWPEWTNHLINRESNNLPHPFNE